MKKILTLACLATALFSVRANAQNVVYDANAQVRQVGNFTKIHVSSAIELFLSQGKENGVAVSAGDDKYTNRIRTEVVDGVLKIYVENGMWNNWNWGNRSLKAYVTVAQLDGLEASGASTVKVTDGLNVGVLDMDISGASTFKCDAGITGTKFHVEISGASHMVTSLKAQGDIRFNINGASEAEIGGNCANLNLEASGASDFKGYDLQADNAAAEASGASTIDISVNKKLDARASGASSIGYKGEAVITSLDVSGASNVKKRS